jgi:serine/threonine-protein kinase HipA
MRSNKISRETIDVLDTLLKSNDNNYISLKDISKILNKPSTATRTLQRTLKELVDNKRAIREGHSSTTGYRAENVERFYRRFDFIYVHKGAHTAGIIFKFDSHYEFYYLSEYIVDLAPKISSLDITIAPHIFEEIPAAFEENIPEGINKEILEIKTKTSEEFKILSELKNNIGDVYFSKTLDDISYKEQSSSPSYLEILSDLLGENPKINVLEDFTIDLPDVDLFPEGHDLTKLTKMSNDGISGFQYKKLVNVDFNNKKVYFSENDSRNYILKPYSKYKSNHLLETYFPHISLNEHLFMSFAKNTLGFRVPYSAIFKSDEGEYHYLVKRFDRYKVHRYAKASFSVFMGLRSEQKYDTTSEKLFKRISEELISTSERMELLKHYVYSVIIQHEDMHTKNLSLIFDKGKVLFSPLYDIATTGLYSTTKGYDSHLKINSKQYKVRPNDFKALCTSLKIKHSEFKKEATKIAIAYINELPSYIDEIKNLGDIPFYRMKLKSKAGESPKWVANGEPIQFADRLSNFHAKRSIELVKLGWCTQNDINKEIEKCSFNL